MEVERSEYHAISSTECRAAGVEASTEHIPIPIQRQVHSIPVYVFCRYDEPAQLSRHDVVGLDVEKLSDRAAVPGDARIRELGISDVATDASVGTDHQSHMNGSLIRPVDYDLTVSAPSADHRRIGQLATQSDRRK